MRNTLRLFGIIALAAVIGFSMAACDNGSTNEAGGETPVLGDYNITGLGPFTYDGSPKQVTITPKDGKSQGQVTVYYEANGVKSTTAPSAVGEYTVTFDVAASGDYGRNAGLYAGKLVINPVGGVVPVADDFIISGLKQIYDGQPKSVGIMPRASKSPGTITIYYAKDGANPTTTAPSAEGSYVVTFDVAASGVYPAASGLVAGQMEIVRSSGALVDPIREDFLVTGLESAIIDDQGRYLFYNDGSARRVYVTAYPGRTEGTITVKYNGVADTGKESDPPRMAGEYAVTIDVTAAPPYAAVSGMLVGTIIIQEGKDVRADMFDISGLSQAWTGTARAVRITPKFEYQELTGITKYYYVNGVRVPNAPFQTGEFDVEFDVAAAGNYKAVQGLKAGTLKIAAGTGASEPAWNDFTYDGLGNYNFDWEKARIVSVIPNNIADSGPVTVKYYQANRYPLGQVSEDIKNVGTYDVYFSVGASITKLATSNDILAGQLTIEPRIPSAEDFEWNMPKVWTYDGDVRDMAAPDSNGHSQYITSKKLGDISAGLLDIYYNGSKTLPRDAGEYVVTFNLAAAANWERASNLTFGTLTILQNTPKGDNFTVAVPAPKTYDGLAASPAIVSTVGAMAVPDGTVTVLYKGSAAAPINAGTYDITIDIAESKNWLGKTGLIPQPQQNLVIYKRDPVEADFKFTSGSLNPKAYDTAAIKIVLAADQSQFPAFPTAPAPVVAWAASVGGTYSGTAPTAAGTYSVRVTVTEPTEEPANWNGAVFYWTQTVENQKFGSVNEFRQWLARQPTTSGSNYYYAQFGPQTLTKEGAGSNGIGGNSFLNLAIYLKDNPNLITTGNTINNTRKRVFLDLSECTVVTEDLSIPYATPAINVLDSDHAAANADTSDPTKWKFTAFTGFEGCTNLVGLKLPDTATLLTIGSGTFGDPLATPNSTLTVNLAELGLGGVISLGSAGNTTLTNLRNLKTLDTGMLGALSKDELYTTGNPASSVITNLTLGAGMTGGTTAFQRSPNLLALKLDTLARFTDTGSDFTGCSKLASVKFPATWVDKIPESTFDNCALLSSVEFPTVSGPGLAAGGEFIGKNAFRQTPALKVIQMEHVLTSTTAAATINNEAFGTALTKVVIKADSLTPISSNLGIDIQKSLKGKSTIEKLELNLAEGKTLASYDCYSPGVQAFMGCANLKNVFIKNMTIVREETFRDCVSLASLEGISNVQIIGIMYGGFAGTKSLKSVNLGSDSVTYLNIHGSSKDPQYYGGTYLNGLSASGDVYGDPSNVPVVRYVPGSFEGSGIEEVILAEGTVDIYNDAFKDCKNLKRVIASGVNGMWGCNIYSGAFENCTSLVTMGYSEGTYKYVEGVVMTPPGSSVWGPNAFKNCTGIKEIKFYYDGETYAPNFTTGYTLEDDIFNGCTGVEKLTVTQSQDWVYHPNDSRFAIRLPNVKEVVWDCTTVPGGTFWDVPNLKTVTFTKTLVDKSSATGSVSGAGGINGLSPAAFWNPAPGMYHKTTPKLDTLKLVEAPQTLNSEFATIPNVKTVIIGTDNGYKWPLVNGKEDTSGSVSLGIEIGPTGTNTAGSFLPPTTNYVNFQYAIGVVNEYAFQGLGSGDANPDYFDVRVGGDFINALGTAPNGIGDGTYNGQFGGIDRKFRKVTIGKDVTGMGTLNFVSSGIESYTVEDGSPYFKADQGVLYQYNEHPVTGALLSTLKLVRYPPKRANPSYAIMDKVTAIDPDAFGTNTILKELTISKDIVSISSPGPKPFGGLGEQFTTVNWNAEKMSSELGSYDTSNGACFPASVTTFNLGNDVKEIPALLLNSANVNVTSLTIPEGVIKMEANSFSELLYLKKVIFNARYMDTAGSGAGSRFGVTGKLDSVTIGEKVENIPAYLFNSADFEKVILPDSLLYIRANAFQNNTALATITLPKNLKIIETAAFLDCERLSPVEILANGVSMALDSFVQIVSNSGIAQVGDDLKVLYDRFDGGAGKYYYISNNLTGTSASKGWEKRGN